MGLSLGLAACEGSAAGTCSTTIDVGTKLTALTDDLKKAQSAGKIDDATAGEIAGKIMDAGSKFGSSPDHRAYCTALDRIRVDAKL
jgi:hypothetical protein